MATFTFNLGGVLRHREFVEKERQRELATAQGELAVLEAELHALDETAQNATNDLRTNRLVGRVDLAFLAAHRRFAIAMQRKALGVAQKIAVARQDVNQKRAALAEAAKDRKAIEKLREKRFEQWRLEQSKKEADALDEAGMQLAFTDHANALDEVTRR
jgi:flagellar FliJ protein